MKVLQVQNDMALISVPKISVRLDMSMKAMREMITRKNVLKKYVFFRVRFFDTMTFFRCS